MVNENLFNLDAEKALLGCVISDGSIYDQLKEKVKASDFYNIQHKQIWNTCGKLHADGQVIDMLTLANMMGKEIDDGYLVKLAAGAIPSTMNAEHYAEIVHDWSVKRSWLKNISELSKRIFEPETTAATIVELSKTHIEVAEREMPREVKGRFTADEILGMTFEPIKWAIPDIVPEGLVFLGGRPKVGKSWMALQMAISIAAGGRFFNKPVEKGEVLYFALEDNKRRIQSRLQKQMAPSGLPITFSHELAPLHWNGLPELYAEITADRYRMILIDTLARATSGLDHSKDAGVLSKICDDLQALAINHNLPLVFIDHTRKPNGMSPNPIDDLIGTTGKSRDADAVLIIYKQQGRSGAILKGEGREMSEIDLSLTWDAQTCGWQCLGDADEIAMTDNRSQIMTALEDLGGKAKLSTIMKTIGRDNKEKGNIYRILGDLIQMGKVSKETIGGEVFYIKVNK